MFIGKRNVNMIPFFKIEFVVLIRTLVDIFHVVVVMYKGLIKKILDVSNTSSEEIVGLASGE